MTPTAPTVETLEAGRSRLAAGVEHGRISVPVSGSVPRWLGQLVVEADAATVAVVVVARRPDDLHGDAAAGWEIGVATAALAAGAQVEGIDARRLARVAAVDDRWAGR